MRRPWALPLLPVWAAGTAIKNVFYGQRWAKPRTLRWPVVSVGSLSAGGAGKTPVVLLLAELLTQHDVAVDVLSRGYGRGSGAVEEVDPAGPASRFGDEPVEIARAGFDIFVGAERYEAGLLAEQSGGFRVHLLDDGFQHRQLLRTANVVLVTLADAQDWLLPAGNLREPLGSLSRADIVVVREEEADALHEVVREHTMAKIWVVARRLDLPASMPGKPIAFCGIARPESFFAMLGRTAGAVAFPDHHPYKPEDFRRLVAAGLATGADGFVTTAKDAVKLGQGERDLLASVGPVAVARLRVTLADEEDAWQHLRGMLGLGERGA